MYTVPDPPRPPKDTRSVARLNDVDLIPTDDQVITKIFRWVVVPEPPPAAPNRCNCPDDCARDHANE